MTPEGISRTTVLVAVAACGIRRNHLQAADGDVLSGVTGKWQRNWLMADDGSAQSQAVWPLPKFYFVVKWDDTELAFQEISGLDVENGPVEYREGNGPAFSEVIVPGMVKSGNITLKKGAFAKDHALFDWLAEVKMNTITRKTLTIELLDGDGSPTMVWKVQNAFPVKVTSTDLKAEGNEVAVESIEISHEGFVIENA